MIKLFKPKCPVCKIRLKEGKNYPEEFGKKFCSEQCRQEYRKKIIKEQSKADRKCCH